MRKVISILLALMLVMGVTIGTVGAVAPAPNWDISGTWTLDFAGGTANREFVDLVQDEYGNVEGMFWWLNGGIWEIGGYLEGYVSGNDLYLKYDRKEYYSVPYIAEFVGTISKTGMEGTFQGLEGTSYYNTWTATGNPTLLYEARISGGGQLRNESGVFDNKDRDINYKISFGLGIFIVNGQHWLDGATVTFHNVSVEEAIGGKFEAQSILSTDFNFPEGIANCRVSGTFNDEPGYSMWIRVQDGGEPAYDNVRFELWKGSACIYDTHFSDDFPGESSTSGTARHYIDKGNLQVEDLR